MLDLRIATPPSWLTVVFADFDAFIVDHAACERKASATGMSLVVKYPDKSQLIEPLKQHGNRFSLGHSKPHSNSLILLQIDLVLPSCDIKTICCRSSEFGTFRSIL